MDSERYPPLSRSGSPPRVDPTCHELESQYNEKIPCIEIPCGPESGLLDAGSVRLAGGSIQPDSCIQKIEILIFSVMGLKLGVDTAQVRGILEMGQASDMDLPVSNIHDLIKICPGPVVYKSPKVLLINHGSSPFGILVDRLEVIEEIRLDRIQLMPVLIEKCTGTKAVWGSVANGEGVILLIDFYKLPCCNTSSESVENISE
jgi:chemotaxis signal transduction protein